MDDRLPGALQCCLALRFLRSQDCLALGFGLTGDFSQSFGFGLAGRFRGFRGEASGDLGFFLGSALRFFFQAAAFFRLRFFYAETRFFSGLGAGCGEITILGSVQIGPRIECRHVLGGRGFAVGKRF